MYKVDLMKNSEILFSRLAETKTPLIEKLSSEQSERKYLLKKCTFFRRFIKSNHPRS